MTERIEKYDLGVVEAENRMEIMVARLLDKRFAPLFVEHEEMSVDVAQETCIPLSIEAELGLQSLELVSYAIPAHSSLERGNVHHGNHADFEKNLSLALGTFIEHLPLGDALVVEYQLTPSPQTGGMSIRCVLHTHHAVATRPSVLSSELAVCLATLSDYFGFRASNPSDVVIHPASNGDVLCIRPVSVACDSRSGAIGFTQSSKGPHAAIRLPIITSNMDEAVFPCGGLINTIKAARAARCDLRLSIRITRKRLDSACKAALRGLLNHDSQSGGNNDDKPLIGTTMTKLALAWSDVTDVFSVDLEATGKNISTSLLNIIASELFPGRQVEIVPKAEAAQNNVAMDMSNVFPLDFGVPPPLLPHPTVLEALAFPRHYNNPVVSLPDSGLVLGHTQLGGFEQPVNLLESDRSRHTYILGATGSGKSSMLFNMICQDMAAGNALIFIDPHGDLFNQVRSSVPENRLSDVVIIDPSDANSTFSLNPMDFGGMATPRKVSRVINDLLDIFGELWDMREAGGPGFENYFRNCILLASSAPENTPPDGLPKGPPTFLTAIEILRNNEYREFLLNRCTHSHLGNDFGGEVVRFFAAAVATTGEQRFANWVPYVSSKLTRLIGNPVMRKIFCTPRRSLDIRQAMDEKRIVLVNLNKGHIGDQDARTLGMLLTKNIFDAALSRSDIPPKLRKPVYCYVDEFSSLITDRDIPNALAEGRKYGLFWILAHQTISQIPRATLDTILGNVWNKFFFRVGLRDAEQIGPELKPHFNASTLTMLPDRHVLAKILVNNKPTPPFVFETAPVVMPETELSAALTLGNRDADTSVINPTTMSAASEELMVDGLMCLKVRPGQADQAKKLQLKITRSLEGWRNMPNPETTPIPPEKGCFFFTRNGSLVFCQATVSDGDGQVIVVTGGHGEDDLRGSKSSGHYMVDSSGRYHTKRPPALSLLGMDLAKKANINFVAPAVLGEKCDAQGAWLLQERAQRNCVAIKPGFFMTFNRSIVFISQDAAKKSPPEAFVCYGGHGITKLSGTKENETFSLTSDGHWLLADFSQAGGVPAHTLPFAGGLSLAEFLPLVGDDAPAWLKLGKARQKRQVAKRREK